MEGEPTLNKGQFELVFRDGHRAPLPAEAVHAFNEPRENRYVFGADQRLEKVCIGVDCGVFTRMPDQANSFVTVLPQSFQERRR